MAYSCCSGNFSSCLLRSCLPSSGSSCGSLYPSNLVYTTTSYSPSTFQLGSSLNTGCQETCIEPISCQKFCEVSSPCQAACYYPRSSMTCSHCQGTYTGSLDFWSSSCCSLGYGSGSCYSVGCGCSGFRSLTYRLHDFPSLSDGSRICYPTYLVASSCLPCC